LWIGWKGEGDKKEEMRGKEGVGPSAMKISVYDPALRKLLFQFFFKKKC